MVVEQITTPVKSKKRRILIVDDNQEFVMNLIDILEDHGYEIEFAFNIDNALESITTFNANVALIDIQLGKSCGFYLIPKLREIRHDILCIMISAFADTENAIKSLRYGAYDYLRKPIIIDDLRSTLNRCFDKISLEQEKAETEEALNVRNHELNNLNSRLRMIMESIKCLSSCTSLLQLTPMILKKFAHDIGVEGGSLFLFDNNSFTLSCSLDPGHSPDNIPLPLKKNSIFDYIIKKKTPLLIEDINKETSFISSGWTGYKHESLIAFPLQYENGNILGILSLHNSLKKTFTKYDIETGAILASYSSNMFRKIKIVEYLQESEDRFRMFTEHNSIAIIIFHDNNIQYVNQAAVDLCGYSEKEMLSWNKKDFTRLIIPDDLPFKMNQINYSGENKDFISHYTYRIMTNKQQIKWVDHYSKTMLYKRRPSIITSLIDITERKNLEEQLRQSQKMEAIGRLAGGMAHDFNNILTSIIGYSGMLLINIDDSSSLHHSINEIMKSAERAASLTRQLLIFSRKHVLQPKAFNLNNTVDNIYKMLRRIIGEDIELMTILKPGLWTIKADPGQIEQVIMNLVVNARDAMLEGGKLIIETKNIELNKSNALDQVSEFKPGHYVMLAISDTGSGMDNEIKSHIFEPFYTTKKEGEGTGLGLATVYGIVKQNNGFIQVNSEPQLGTTFKIYIPQVEEDLEIIKQPSIRHMPCGSETILLVEDDDLVRIMIKKIIETQGYNILQASNPAEAIDISKIYNGTIDLLITDIVLPQMNGFELAKELTAIHIDIKVLYMSGYSDKMIVQNGVLNSEEITFLQKPFTPEEMANKVREVLDGIKHSHV